MGNVNRPAMRVSVHVSNRAIEQRVCRALAALDVRYLSHAELAGDVTILDTSAAQSLAVLPERPIVVCTGSHVVDLVLAKVNSKGGHLIAASELRPDRLLGVLFTGARSREGVDLSDYLVGRLEGLPHASDLVTVFLQAPARNLSLPAVATQLGWSRRRVRAVVAELEWWRVQGSRTEYLWTFLRVEAWIWFTQRGIPRRHVERFLGIVDRTNFRRACRRACVGVPWEGSGSSSNAS